MASSERSPLRVTPQVILGLGAILFGLLLTVDNLRWFDTWRFVKYWPFVIVGVGLVQVLQSDSRSGRILGGIVMFAGAVWTADFVYDVPVDISDFWPLALIALGVIVLSRARNRGGDAGAGQPPWTAGGGTTPWDAGGTGTAPWDAGRAGGSPWDAGGPGGASREAGRSATPPVAGLESGTPPQAPGGAPAATTDQVVNEFAVWAGKQRRNASSAFRRAELTAIMGGVELDLRAATTATGEAIVDVFVMWGGVEIWVPPDWAVSNQVSLLMAGAEDKSTGTQAARHRLIVRGFVIMGGLEIKT